MARIGVLIENMFEDSEYKKPATAFKKAKHELVHLGAKKESLKEKQLASRLK